MLQEETLQRVKANRYEDPEGEFLELVRSDTNTITVLTRISGDKVSGEDLPDPSKYTVSELETELEEKVRTEGLTPEQQETLIEAEQDGKNRATAIDAIQEV